ncbi:hypothetical protein CHS0354_034869 [Potamilus streckersoni]|uniref:Uncharacterized protein n=1 Tax=Potamilus streckersoni TaxID=2493646 RepID=A0AAE0VRV9_9BIVA|nr:hypothetical protein CHS0354_034869 [Potamilus streckersoni]
MMRLIGAEERNYKKGATDKTQVMPSEFIYKSYLKPVPLKSSETITLKSPDLKSSTCIEAKSSTSLITISSSACNYSCDKCGSYLDGNPLVKVSIIPEALSELLPLVPAKPQTPNSKKK